MGDVKISIIVPIYNIEDYLQRCVESIIGQSYKNIEIILVDDGSTDACPWMCDEFSKKDDRIIVIHKENGGLVSARKAGVAVATGDYVLNVDGDDWIEKNRVNELVKKGILTSFPDMVYMSGYSKDYGEDSARVDYKIPFKVFYGNEILEQVFPLLIDIHYAFRRKVEVSLWVWAIKRELIQKNQDLVNNEIRMGEDSVCIWFCLLEAKSVAFIRQKGYHYIHRKTSITYLAATSSNDSFFRIKIWYSQLSDFLIANHVSENIMQIFYYLAIWMIMNANYELLLKKNEDYLYPFPKVKRGSTIVIYGAGKLGCSLVKYLDKVNRFRVLLWVDQNEAGITLFGHQISPIENILKITYDYIVVAIQNIDVAMDAKKNLVDRGVKKDKIELMNLGIVTKLSIPDELKE